MDKVIVTDPKAKPPTLAHIRTALKISDDAFGNTRDLLSLPKDRTLTEMAARGFKLSFGKDRVSISKKTIGGKTNVVTIKRDPKTGRPLESVVSKGGTGTKEERKQGVKVLKDRLISRARTMKDEREKRVKKAQADLEKAKARLERLMKGKKGGK